MAEKQHVCEKPNKISERLTNIRIIFIYWLRLESETSKVLIGCSNNVVRFERDSKYGERSMIGGGNNLEECCMIGG